MNRGSVLASSPSLVCLDGVLVVNDSLSLVVLAAALLVSFSKVAFIVINSSLALFKEGVLSLELVKLVPQCDSVDHEGMMICEGTKALLAL